MNDKSSITPESGCQGIIRFVKGAFVTARILVGAGLCLAAFVPLVIHSAPWAGTKKIQKSVPLNSETISPATEGKFVSISGELISEETVGDPLFLKNGPYIVLNRKVEMCSWSQGYSFGKEPEGKFKEMMDELDAHPQGFIGKRRERIGNYHYIDIWSDKPADSSLFKHPEGHENPPLSLETESFRVQSMKIGAYRLDVRSLERLPRPSRISLTPDMLIPSVNARLEGNYILVGEGTLKDPEIGDLRITYTAVKSGSIATVFGQPNGEIVKPYLSRAVAGSREEAIAKIASDQHVLTGITLGFHVMGFLMTWVGLCLFMRPVERIRDPEAAPDESRAKYIYRMFLVSLVWYLIAFVLVSVWYKLTAT